MSETLPVITVFPKFRSLTVNALGASVITTEAATITVPKEGFWTKVKLFFESLWHSSPTWIQLASSTLTLVAPLVEVLIGIYDPSEAPVAATILGDIQTDLATAATIISQAGPAPTLSTVLNAVLTNLQTLLQTSGVGSSTTQNVEAIVALVTQEIKAILSALPSAKASVPEPAG